MIQANPTPHPRLLILDSDRIVMRAIAESLRAAAYDVRTANNLGDARVALEDGVDILLADLDLPGEQASAVLKDLRRTYGRTAVVVMSRYGSVDAAKEATRDGASDYLTKPIHEDALHAVLTRVTRHQALLSDDGGRGLTDTAFAAIVGRDRRMRKVLDLAEAVADSRTNVLILGESGTGKSLLARAIHKLSPRRDRPFVEIACGSLPDTLLESELFGHVKGSFTGATVDKAGRFVTADTGTVFLDEINSAPPAMQVKLLRVLQERCLEPVGSDTTRQVDVRTILASNADLTAMVAAGTFRQDLYYRINVVTLHLPPLRERIADIPMLAEAFLRRFAREAGRQAIGFTPAAMTRLLGHAWPGNVRELENAVERAVVLSRRPTIDADDLPDTVIATAAPPTYTEDGPMPLERALEGPERRILQAALERNAWNRQATAAELDINRTTLYKKMRKHGLDVGERN